MKLWLGVVILAVFAFVGAAIYRSFGNQSFGVPEDRVASVSDEAVGMKAVPVEVGGSTFSLTIPDDFELSVLAQDLGSPRVLISDPEGRLLVSLADEGQVVAVDTNQENSTPEIVVDSLNQPHGLELRCEEGSVCRLYVAETDKVVAYDYDPQSLSVSNPQVLTNLPSGGGHSTRSLQFLPNDPNILLISVGSSCNVCLEDDTRRAAITAYNLETGELTEYASGLRNAVFLTVRPETAEVWVTEMGRDWLGDDTPPDEINILQRGTDYGWPYCYGMQITDENFGNQPTENYCTEETVGSHIDIQAHSAPLGLYFFDSQNWPQAFANDLLVAYHGSWNRVVPTGYKVVQYQLDEQGNYASENDFITGFLQDGQVYGRPTGVLILTDAVYVADDHAGAIYKLTYAAEES